MLPSIVLRDGFDGDSEPIPMSSGVVSRRDVLDVNEGESLASITQRAYGINTPFYRDRILAANGNLRGTVNVPR